MTNEDDHPDPPADRVASEFDAGERLRQLHAATRDLMGAKTPTDVADVATETARDVLELEVNAVFFADGDRLVPISWTDRATELFGDIDPMRRGEAMGWRVYERDEPAVFDDVRNAPVMQNPDTPMRSEMLFPLGDHGLFIAGAAEPATFDEDRATLARVFSDNVETALDRAERERELQRQNERLDEFTSVVSHDLRNPLNVAEGHLELAREECESDHLDDVDEALDRMGTLIEDLLTLARHGGEIEATERLSLGAVVEDAWSDVAGGDLAIRVEDATVDADRGCLRELLSNLLSNAADHGASAVRVAPLADAEGFAVADDGPGIPPDEREQVFERGYTTDEDGTGFGLAIVREIAEGHGWSVSVTDSEAGGARFEVRTSPNSRTLGAGAA